MIEYIYEGAQWVVFLLVFLTQKWHNAYVLSTLRLQKRALEALMLKQGIELGKPNEAQWEWK